jgi:hypothetical protein
MSNEPRERRTKRKTEDMPEPPGEFLSEDLRDATSRFLDEVKRQVKRRKEPDTEPKLGPPERRKP